MNAEVWRDIPSLSGVLASSLGRVMVIPFRGGMPHGGKRPYGGKPRLGSWDGDRYILQFRGKTHRVARLVCEAFNGPAPFDGAVCMHHDENSANNMPGNLRWGTQKENLNAPGFIAYCRSRVGEDNPYVKGRLAA